MKIKLFIVTYNSPEYLDKNLRSAVASDLVEHDYEITIINNHSNFKIAEDLLKDWNIKVIHNEARPDWSTGHLSRSWNQCLIHGFKSLIEPDCDILVHAQDDLTWAKNWASFIIDSHKKYNFITFGTGDGMCSYLPEAVFKIGLWDERFSGIGCQEGDYYLRALKWNKENSSINDAGHMRLLNPLPGNYGGSWEKGGNSNVCDTPRHEDCPTDGINRLQEHNRSKRVAHDLSRIVFANKWGQPRTLIGNGHVAWEVNWTLVNVDDPPEMSEKQEILYPYFENALIQGQEHPAYKLFTL